LKSNLVPTEDANSNANKVGMNLLYLLLVLRLHLMRD
jgi:hypothetical protein